ncbi:hypothetical protein [Alkalihalobacillus sp. LMS39]|uniref:hypothetical protein n=1 Tax=Alkalihalobacillus sp. LMS39 TaxID=2924032 RepID=UPI001FB4F2F0|nr:hypothetical protein [Alkalihalobacillus sp. LMS39]UOE94546.1 hypothetical protein MM271_02440 [Alkalihalobacillus sp. LMS39]
MSHGFECHSCGRFRHDFFSRCHCGFDFRHHHRDCRSLCDCKRPCHHHRDHHCCDSHRCHGHHSFKHDRICDDRFNVRLRGLDGGLAFRLRQLVGCVVKLEVECGDECNRFKGIICHVGRDFVEIEKIDDGRKRKKDCHCKSRCKCKSHKDNFLIVPLHEIKVVKVDDDKKFHHY